MPLIILGASSAFALDDPNPTDDCACEQTECHACEEKVDLKFYTAKCAGGRKVKSCAKPLCEARKDAPKNCLTFIRKKYGRKIASVIGASQAGKKIKKSDVPTFVKTTKVKVNIGVVVVSKGKSWVLREGRKRKTRIGLKVFEKDIIETSASGKVKILFKDKNVLNVVPDSKIQLTEITLNTKDKDRTMIDLMYGTIRSKVKKKYDGANNNYYRVRTRAAIAGVRGTDFVVSYKPGSSELETKVSTLTGKVELAGRLSQRDQGKLLETQEEKLKVGITPGMAASHRIDKSRLPSSTKLSQVDLEKYASKGYLTAAYKMSAEEIRELREKTRYEQSGSEEEEDEIGSHKVSDASQQEMTCSAPQAPFNHCMWKCVGNPAGEDRCRTDLSGVKCQRKRCNANGKWAEVTRIPASHSDFCPAQGVKLQDCDY